MDEIIQHELGECDEYCMYCYNELPQEVTLNKFLGEENV